VETAIGVFAERERAEEAVNNLLERNVPEHSIAFLTRSESEAKNIGKQLGAYAGGFVGGAAGLSAGVAAATLLAVPGIGPVFALGFGAAALLGLLGAGTGAAVGATATADPTAPQPTAGTGSVDDATFFRRVLKEGHSVIVVRSDSPQTAAVACEVLDRLGIGMEKGAARKTEVSSRQVEGVAIINVVGKIALEEGTALLRDAINASLERGTTRFLLNLAGVDFMDSAGIGELVRTLTSIRHHRGFLKLVSPSSNVYHLLRITKLDRVFDIEQDEAAGLNSFRQGPAAAKSAG
jgi:anti-sigma B factor antagonist